MPSTFDQVTEELTKGIPEHILQTLPLNEIAGSDDFEFALRWAFKNIGQEPEGLQDHLIPHPACREVLKFHREDPKSFFSWVAKYDQLRQEKDKSKRSFQDDQRTHFKLIQKVRDYYRDVVESQSASTSSLPATHASTAATNA